MWLTNRIEVHHFMQEHHSSIQLPTSLSRHFSLTLRQIFLYLFDLIHKIIGFEERWTHGDIVVFIPEPSVVGPGITTDRLAVFLNRTVFFLILTTENYVESFLG